MQVGLICGPILLQGNLSAFVEKKPEAKSYYDLKEASIKFTLPEPGFLEGVKSKDRAILKMHSVGYTCAFLMSLRFLLSIHSLIDALLHFFAQSCRKVLHLLTY